MRRIGKHFLTAGVLATSSVVFGQHNSTGWIETSAWTILLPLRDLTGCYGGGPLHMKRSRLAPREIGTADPRPGDHWEIDFGESAADGFGGGAVFDDPTWFTTASLETDLGLGVGSLDTGDAVDFGEIVRSINAMVVPALADPSPLPLENVLAVATTYVRNDFGQPLEVDVCTASAASIQVWVNHKCITNVSACRGLDLDCAERYPAILPTGVSKIAVLVWSGIQSGSGQWSFRLGLERVQNGHRFTDEDRGQATFIGSSKDAAGQEPYCLKRTLEPFEFLCPVREALVTLQGSGPGDDDEILTVTECIFVDDPDALEVTVIPDPAEPGLVAVTDLIEPNEPSVGEFWTRRVVGEDCGGESGTTVDGFVYSSASTAGGTGPVEAGDDFEYAFGYYCGDFDLVIQITGRVLEQESDGAEWGAFGLMARSSLEPDSRSILLADSDPLAADAAVHYRSTDGGSVAVSSFASGAPSEPVYLRLTRRGSSVQTWISDEAGIGTGVADPCDDLNWSEGSEEDWDEAEYAQLYVGFANFGGGGGGCPSQSVSFEVIKWLGCEVEVPENTESSGKKLTWTVPREVVGGGLQYRIAYARTGSSRHVGYAESENAFRPEARTEGPDAIPFNVDQSGPLGDFDNAHDIGDPPSPGAVTLTAGIYRLTASGTSIGEPDDRFFFLYKEVTGDFEMTGRLRRALAGGGLPGPHGLMARWTCETDSKYSMLQGFPLVGGISANPLHAFRLYHGVAETVIDHYRVDDCSLLGGCNQERMWMRLLRCGNTIYTYLPKDQTVGSASGWSIVGSDTDHEMPSRLLAGAALASTTGTSEVLEVGSFSCDPLAKLELSCRADREPIIDEEFDAVIGFDDTGEQRYFQVQKDPSKYKPRLTGGRLRLTEQQAGCLPPDCTDALGVANAAWFLPEVFTDRVEVGKAANVGFFASFKVYATHDGARADPLANPSEGLAFVAMELGDNLDLPTLVGGPGGALGYEGCTILERVEGHASMAVELDLHQDPSGRPAYEPFAAGSEDFDGEYHIAVDVNSSVSSLETNRMNGVTELPDLFHPAGVDVEVEYQAGGWVTVHATGEGFSTVEAVSTFIAPLEGDIVFGFTASTGETATRLEIDDFKVFVTRCTEVGRVTIEGPTEAGVGETVALEAVAAGFAPPLTYAWTIHRGPGTLTPDPLRLHRARLVSSVEGTTEVEVKVTDSSGGSATAAHTVLWSAPKLQGGDTNGDGRHDLSDAVRILNWLFLGAAAPPCVGAGDINSDATVNITDPINLLNYLFLGAPKPRGLDSCVFDTGESGCASYSLCN